MRDAFGGVPGYVRLINMLNQRPVDDPQGFPDYVAPAPSPMVSAAAAMPMPGSPMDMLAPPVQTNPVADVIAQMAAGASAGTGSGGEGGGQEAIAISDNGPIYGPVG